MKNILRVLCICPVILVLFISLTGCSTVKYTGRTQAMLINAIDEKDFSRKTWTKFRNNNRESNISQYKQALDRVGKKLSAVADTPHLKWEFIVFESSQPCAFCLPDAKVAVSTELFKYVQNDTDLASIIAHEIGHSLAHHGGERMSEWLLTGEFDLEAIKSSSQADPKLFQAFGVAAIPDKLMPYHLILEKEADYISLLLLAKAGYSPNEAIKFWDKMGAQSYRNLNKSYFATHPYVNTRLSEMRRKMAEFQALYSLAKIKQDKGETYSSAMRNPPVFAARKPMLNIKNNPQQTEGDLLNTAHKALLNNDSESLKNAIAKAHFATQQNPNDPKAWMVYGKILAMVNNSMEVTMMMEGVFNKVIELEPKNFEARRYLADSLYNFDLFDAAIKELEMIMTAGQYLDAKSIILLNICYVRDEQSKRGIKFFKSLAEKHPENDGIKIQLAVLAHHIGDKRLAMSELRKIVNRPGPTTNIKILAGKLMFMNQERR